MTAGFIPQSQFDAVPQAKFVVDQAQVVLHDMLGSAQRICNLAVFAAFGYVLDDDVFAFTGPAVGTRLSCHNCLL